MKKDTEHVQHKVMRIAFEHKHTLQTPNTNTRELFFERTMYSFLICLPRNFQWVAIFYNRIDDSVDEIKRKRFCLLTPPNLTTGSASELSQDWRASVCVDMILL